MQVGGNEWVRLKITSGAAGSVLFLSVPPRMNEKVMQNFSSYSLSITIASLSIY